MPKLQQLYTMPRGDSYQLQGGQGGTVINSASGAVTGTWRWIQVVEDTIFTVVTATNLTDVTKLQGITHPGGSGFGATNITALTVSSGTVIAYDA